MYVTVVFRHMDASDALRNYATEKTERIRKYLIEPIEAHWVLSVEKFRHIADVTIVANGITIRGEDQTEDLYSAIDMVMDKIEKQVRKHKERIKNHKVAGGAKPLSAKLNVLSYEDAGEATEPMVITTESYFIKPMSVDEAVMQIDLLNNDFMVFTNSASHNINVLYRRKDGNYGLIDAGQR
ncbi:MAG: ribosome-associated translation inhibitor RaiA [Deltaproteobacteria bacterium]|nr:ribosome-associated translation inhibitor RaiA [Deltaproteobacteria bacterium]MBI3754820.1 ribosome-associated translation inhibitor RaiA [Deltaproteobacteria bacterium]